SNESSWCQPIAITTPDTSAITISGTSRRSENFARATPADDGSLLAVMVDPRASGRVDIGRHRGAGCNIGPILAGCRTSKWCFHRLVTLAHALVPATLVLALTTTGSLPYKPARFWARRSPIIRGRTKGRGQALAARERADIERQRRTTREADLSTEQSGAQAPSRFSCSHGDQRRAQGRCRAARARAQAAQCLNLRRGALRRPHAAAQATRRLPGRRGHRQGADRRFRVTGAQARRWRSHPRRLHRVEEGRNRGRAQSGTTAA